MKSEIALETVEELIACQVDAFRWSVVEYLRQFRVEGMQMSFSRMVGFEGVWPYNGPYCEFKFLEKFLESRIRDSFVNPILKALFDLYGYDSKWPILSTSTLNTTNDGYEKHYGYEFILDYGGKRIAYLYSSPALSNVDLDALVKDEKGLNEIGVIDWKDVNSPHIRSLRFGPTSVGSVPIRYITIRRFLDNTFPQEVGNAFITSQLDAVAKANDLIGFHTIPSLSMAHLYSFKQKVLNDLKALEDELRQGRLKVGERELSEGLTETELEIIRKTLFDEGLYEVLVGDDGFSKCFVTSEYLREAFKCGGEFDYTSLACGYLKSVEQLEYRLMEIMLDEPGTDRLHIQKKHDEEPSNPQDVLNRGRSVRFRRINKQCFYTSMGSLRNLITANRSSWRIGRDGVSFANEVMKKFTDEDRNELLHQRNIDSIEEVESFRSDAITILFLLIGGYRTSESLSQGSTRFARRNELGYEILPYDEFFDAIMSSTGASTTFLIQYGETEPIEVKYSGLQGEIKRDREGHARQKLCFEKMGVTGADQVMVVIDDNNLPDRALLKLRNDRKMEVWKK